MRTLRPDLLLAFCLFLLAPAAHAAEPVSTALILAIDTSGSVDVGEFKQQMTGTAKAIASPDFAEAVHVSPTGSIAIAVVCWSGLGHQEVVVPWTVVHNGTEALDVAERIAGFEHQFNDFTGIADMMRFAEKMFAELPNEALQKVLDISGDGIDNVDFAKTTMEMRDKLVGEGIRINGLPILNEDATLDIWYEDNVRGGPGSFVMPVKDYGDYGTAILRKIMAEIT